MLTSFVAGVAAGYGIAIPVGAIAVLIVHVGLRRGWRAAAAAGSGAASADLVYAGVAAGFGTAIAGLIQPYARPLAAVSVVVLVAIAVRGLLAARRDAAWGSMPPAGPAAGTGPGPAATYARFVGLTLLNPATVAYFAALVVALPAGGVAAGTAERIAFVAGAGLASWSWQLLLAAFGSVLHGRLSPRLRLGTAIVGNLIVLGFAARIALEALG